MRLLASNYLVPNVSFILGLIVFLIVVAVFVVVTVVPFVRAILRGQWLWVVVIVVFPFLGGLAWWLFGRPTDAAS